MYFKPYAKNIYNEKYISIASSSISMKGNTKNIFYSGGKIRDQ